MKIDEFDIGELSMNSKIYIQINDEEPKMYVMADMFLYGRINVINKLIEVAIQHHKDTNISPIDKIEFIAPLRS